MIPDNGKHVIVSYSYGAFEAYPCTVSNAQALLAQYEENLPAEIREVRDMTPATHHLVSVDRVLRALRSVVKEKVGAECVDLRALLYGNPPRKGEPDTREAGQVTAELKTDATMWCVSAGINPIKLEGIDGAFLTRNQDMLPQSLFSGVLARAKGKTLIFVDDWILDLSDEYSQLKTGAWNASAHERQIVSRYLRFITNHLTHRDTKYEVAPLNQTPT